MRIEFNISSLNKHRVIYLSEYKMYLLYYQINNIFIEHNIQNVLDKFTKKFNITILKTGK